MTEEWKPYNFTEDGEIKGRSTEIVEEVLEHAELTYSISVLPWSRAYSMAIHKKDVLIYTIIRIPQRESLFKWVRPLGQKGSTSLYRLKSNSGVNISNIEDAKNYSIVTNQNSMDEIWMRDNGFKNLLTPSKVENSVTMFFKGRSDLIAFADTVMEEEFRKFGFDPDDCVKVVSLFETIPYMAFSTSTDDKLVDKVKKSYDELLNQGKIIIK